MKSKLVAGGCLLVAFVVALVLVRRWMMGRSLYTPGALASGEGLSESLEPPAQQGDPSYFQVTSSVRLFHFEDGAGDDVLVLHGGPGVPPSKPWPLGTLTGQRRLVYFHQRGCGLSTRPIERSPDGIANARAVYDALGLPQQIADIERIRRILGREKLVLLGHSFGAFVAALYAAEFPDRVEALVAVAPANLAVLPSDNADLYGWMAARLSGEELARFETYRAAQFDFTSLFRKSDDELVAVQAPFRDFYAAAARMNGSSFPPADRPGGWMPVASYLSLGRSHDWRDSFERVRAPVLVVHGSDDLQPLAANQAFATMFPRAEVATIEGAGHFVFMDRPTALAEKVSVFLAKVR